MPVLSVVKGDGNLETYPLRSPRFTLGRDGGNDLVVDDPLVSREHAVLLLTPGGYSIQDLGSKNGTLLNDVPIGSSPRMLTHGDTILLGASHVCLRFNTTEETVTAVYREEAVHGIVVDFSGREVLVQGQRLTPLLTRKEFDILTVLWQRRGEACSRDVLAAHGWPEREQGDVGDTEIDQYIRRLRRRLGDNGKTHRIILTVRGYGYKIP